MTEKNIIWVVEEIAHEDYVGLGGGRGVMVAFLNEADAKTKAKELTAEDISDGGFYYTVNSVELIVE